MKLFAALSALLFAVPALAQGDADALTQDLNKLIECQVVGANEVRVNHMVTVSLALHGPLPERPKQALVAYYIGRASAAAMIVSAAEMVMEKSIMPQAKELGLDGDKLKKSKLQSLFKADHDYVVANALIAPDLEKLLALTAERAGELGACHKWLSERLPATPEKGEER